MEGAAPPGVREGAGDTFVRKRVMTVVAGVELVHRHLVEQRQFGLLEVARLARDLPQIETQPQPVGLRAAFIALDARREHLRHRALDQHVARLDDARPQRFGLIEIPGLAGHAIERDDAAHGGQEAVAMLRRMAVGALGDRARQREVAFVLRDAVELDYTFERVGPADITHRKLLAVVGLAHLG